ncbi:MAG: hypothetical protein V1888_01075 [archaeon]
MEIDLVRNRYLSEKEKAAINDARVANWGEGALKDFDEDYESDTLWIFVRDEGKIVSLGGMRPIEINYLGKCYNIFGICSTISVVRGKGYGKVMIGGMLDYIKQTGKSALGFTTQTEFFVKAGFKAEKDFIKRFVWVKGNGERVLDNEGDGIFWNGKDGFLKRVLESDSLVEIGIEHW